MGAGDVGQFRQVHAKRFTPQRSLLRAPRAHHREQQGSQSMSYGVGIDYELDG
jgi:hypothetical protein